MLRVLDRGILTGSGSVEVPALAREYAEYVGVRHALVFNAGTAALHACAVAADLRPGDEAIVPAFTYVASAMALTHHGVRPTFCDVDPNTFNLDPASVEQRISHRTRAIVAVHLHGMPCEMNRLLDIASRHGLAIIEDLSQAHGATYNGQKVGTFGLCGGASLNATKNLPGGEGGLFVTNHEECVVAARRLRYMGEDLPHSDPDAGRRYWSHGIGWNYRGHELPAAFTRSQLARIDEYSATARRNARILTEGLAEIPGLRPPLQPEGSKSVWYIYRVVIEPEEIGFNGEPTDLRDRLVAALTAEGLRATIWQHHPLPAHPAFRRTTFGPWQPAVDAEPLHTWDPGEYPVASRLCDLSFVLGTGSNPLAAQSAEVMHGYIRAVRKVMGNLDLLLTMEFEPPTTSRDALEFNRSKGVRGAPAMLPLEEAAP